MNVMAVAAYGVRRCEHAPSIQRFGSCGACFVSFVESHMTFRSTPSRTVLSRSR